MHIYEKGFIKMGSGVNIDCRYVIRVSKLMEIANLPMPRKRQTHLEYDGEMIPIVTVECEV